MTHEQFKKLAPGVNTLYCDLFNELVRIYTMPEGAIPEFLANVLHETGGLKHFEENMNYSAEGLVKTWQSRFSLTPQTGKLLAKDFHRQPQKIANAVYGRRMGNIEPNDGWNFRGGGGPHLTGRDAYRRYRDYVNPIYLTTFSTEQIADRVRTNPRDQMESAFWFFCIFKDLEAEAVRDEMKTIVKAWNGGFIGMPDREAKLKLVQSTLA